MQPIERNGKTELDRNLHYRILMFTNEIMLDLSIYIYLSSSLNVKNELYCIVVLAQKKKGCFFLSVQNSFLEYDTAVVLFYKSVGQF